MFKQTIIILLLMLGLFPAMTFAAPEVTAKSAIVIEASTGKVLYAKNADERHYPASTTKMMTLIVALERGNLNDFVTASENAVNTEGSSLSLISGEKLKMLDMLYGIMMISGNDATVAVAEHIAGSVSNYAALMTQKAHAIGATNTNFTNTSGLPDENHYSTAADLAKIAAYGFNNPLFTQIVSTQHKVIPAQGNSPERDLYNENRMLWLYEGANGVKTGYTDAAGRCLVSGAKREGIQLVVVVLDSEHMWDDSISLMDYGFSCVKPLKIMTQGDVLKTVRVDDGTTDFVHLQLANDLNIPVSDNDADSFSTQVIAPNRIEAPVESGQKVGTVKVFYKDKEITSVDLLSADSAAHKSFFGKIWGSLWKLFSYVVKSFA